jgi:predicted acyl esterase
MYLFKFNFNFYMIVRSARMWWPFSRLPDAGGKPFSLVDNDLVRAYLKQGWAVVLYDIRGGGASQGRNKYPW